MLQQTKVKIWCWYLLYFSRDFKLKYWSGTSRFPLLLGHINYMIFLNILTAYKKSAVYFYCMEFFQFGIFMPPKELWEAYSNRTVSPSVCPSVPLCVRCKSPIFFEVGIPNLVCGCILGWQSVAYHFRVTVTLTSHLVFRIIVSGAYLLYYLR